MVSNKAQGRIVLQENRTRTKQKTVHLTKEILKENFIFCEVRKKRFHNNGNNNDFLSIHSLLQFWHFHNHVANGCRKCLMHRLPHQCNCIKIFLFIVVFSIGTAISFHFREASNKPLLLNTIPQAFAMLSN